MNRTHTRAVAALVALVVVTATLPLTAGALGGVGAPGGAPSAQMAAPEGATVGERTDCTNGTSPAVVACGYNPGPTAVSLTEQSVAGGSVQVEAVNLSEGGFVAVHTGAYVDGAFTESVVGVSGYLSPGLHRDVTVPVDGSANGATVLVAVVYRDDDGDGSFDFVATDGADDRPYTMTYSAAAGNVTDEAGDVVGDVAAVERAVPFTAGVPGVGGDVPADLDGDGLYEDVDGDGDADFGDAIGLAFADFAAVNADPDQRAALDFDGDGDVDFADAIDLAFR